LVGIAEDEEEAKVMMSVVVLCALPIARVVALLTMWSVLVTAVMAALLFVPRAWRRGPRCFGRCGTSVGSEVLLIVEEVIIVSDELDDLCSW
jgi:hypothetical protein